MKDDVVIAFAPVGADLWVVTRCELGLRHSRLRFWRHDSAGLASWHQADVHDLSHDVALVPRGDAVLVAWFAAVAGERCLVLQHFDAAGGGSSRTITPDGVPIGAPVMMALEDGWLIAVELLERGVFCVKLDARLAGELVQVPGLGEHRPVALQPAAGGARLIAARCDADASERDPGLLRVQLDYAATGADAFCRSAVITAA